MSTNNKEMIRLTWKRFHLAIRMLIQSEQGAKAMIYLLTLVFMMLAINGLNVINSYVGRDFMSAIANKNPGRFQSLALVYALVFIVSAVMAALFRFIEERLGILWREQLTWHLTQGYLSERTYYRLGAAAGVANPDQRISEDVRAFTTTTLSFLLLIMNGTVTALSFSGVLWSISPLLFTAAVAYAIFGSVMAVALGKPLVRINYNQLDMEANFRADLIHIRENSESIALSRREGRFRARLRKRLDDLTENFHHLIRINRNLGFFTNGYNYFIQIIPAIIMAPVFIAGKVEFGVITQSTMAFATLLGAFSLIVTQFQSITAFTAVTARLQDLNDAIEKTHRTLPCAIHMEETPERVCYVKVTLKSSDNARVLIDHLDLEILRQSRWLVACDEDAPKIALFRATAGIWDCGDGWISRPCLDDILFLPERPYLPPGALRDVLLRTGMELATKDADIMTVIRWLGLEACLERVGGLDAYKDWDDVLSIGEQHLLSIARIILAHPAFVFLDRPGSSLPRAQIATILDMLRDQGIGVVVFAKGAEADLRYDSILEIEAGGKWVVHTKYWAKPGSVVFSRGQSEQHPVEPPESEQPPHGRLEDAGPS